MPFRAMNISKIKRHSSAVVALASKRCISRTSFSDIEGEDAGITLGTGLRVGGFEKVRMGTTGWASVRISLGGGLSFLKFPLLVTCGGDGRR